MKIIQLLATLSTSLLTSWKLVQSDLKKLTKDETDSDVVKEIITPFISSIPSSSDMFAEGFALAYSEHMFDNWERFGFTKSEVAGCIPYTGTDNTPGNQLSCTFRWSDADKELIDAMQVKIDINQ